MQVNPGLQKTLGLGDVPLRAQSLVDAWVQQTGRPASELTSLLRVSAQKLPLSDAALLAWVENWRNVRQFKKKGKHQ